MITDIITQILLLLAFLVLSIVCLYFPGNYILGNKIKKLPSYFQVLLSFIVGITVFMLLAVVLGLLNLRFLTLPIILIPFVISLIKKKTEPIAQLKEIFKDKIFLLIAILGIVVLGMTNFPNGLLYSAGEQYWSSQGHDGLWHVAVMQSVFKDFPIQNPLLPGELLANYHFASDIFFGEFYRIFSFFSPFDLYFRFFPVLLAFLLGLSTYTLTKFNWDKRSAHWAMVFTYFAGSFGYIYSIMQGRFFLAGETTFWASQGHTILGNPPHAMGIIWLTTIYALFSLYLKEKNKNKLWLKIIFLLGFGLVLVKASSGAILIGSVGVIGIYSFIKHKNALLLGLFTALALSNVVLLKIVSPTAESFLLFEPLWFTRTMMVVKLDNVDWELRRQHYLSLGTLKAWLRIIQLEVSAIILFIVGNSGMRIIGFYTATKNLFKKEKTFDLLLISASIGSIVSILFFVQKGLIYNLIQFMQIHLHLLGIYAGVTLATLSRKIKNRRLKITLIVIILALTVPTSIGTLIEFYGLGHKPLAIVSNAELSALNWVKDNTPKDSLILTKPFDKNAHYQYHQHPLPIYSWYSTPYVTVYTDRKVMISAEEQLLITKHDLKEEIGNNNRIFTALDKSWNKDYLEENQIDYIYAHRNELDVPLDPEGEYLSVAYENEEAVVYQVLK